MKIGYYSESSLSLNLEIRESIKGKIEGTEETELFKRIKKADKLQASNIPSSLSYETHSEAIYAS
ncbi:hypothetical protein C1645_841592 [Glomus cerebriforme]|uniref:Uncharacterized protein n=1 Tax=Glomus cerebriforme TaxID=658196 RepID=A0A397S0K3_9GLOM|nr:hypothetical protein C1645_841592 [Glomus cerebriforme]